MNKSRIGWLKERLHPNFLHYAVFLKWMLFACLIGLLVGGVGTLFHYSIGWATQLRTAQPWVLWLLPAAGIAIVLLYKVCGMDEDRGTNLVLLAVRANEKISVRMAPLVFVATVLTHLCGGSSGREGAALQIGGSIASKIGRLLHFDEKDERIMTMCGMSAAFAALFGTPLSAAVFSMEVVSVGVMYYSAIVPCILSAVIGFAVAGFFQVEPERYHLAGIPQLDLLPLLQVILLGILCAVLSILFCKIMKGAGGLYRKLLPNKLLRIAAGGALVIGLTYLAGTFDYNGAGMDVIDDALFGQAKPEAFAMKLLFTAVTLGAGFKGGEIVPTFFVGATFGNTMGRLIGLNPSFGAGIGLIALFCGVTNCPLTSLIMSIELFGRDGMLFFAIVCAVSYMLSGYHGLYSEQKIVYSKLKPEFIDKKSG